MKKLALCLVLLMILTTFISCGRRQDILNQIESEKAAESAAEESSVITMGGGRETVPSEPDTQTPDNPADTSNPDDPPESYKPPEITIPDPNDKYPNNMGYQYTGGINKGGDGYYTGVTMDELSARYDGSYGLSLTSHWNTPLAVFFRVTANYQWHYACYNKLTGHFICLPARTEAGNPR